MKLNDIKSIKLVPGWAKAECIVDSVLSVFDEYIRELDARLESLPFNASVRSVSAMTDEDMNMFADEMNLLSYNRSFDRSFREQIVYNTSSAFRKYGTCEGVEKIILNSSPVHDVGVFIGERASSNAWEIYVNSSDPIDIGASEIYNHNAIYSGRVSQKFDGIKYTSFTNERNSIGIGATAGCYVLCNIDIPVTAKRAYIGYNDRNSQVISIWLGPLNPDGILNEYGQPVSGYIPYENDKSYKLKGIYLYDGTKIENSDFFVQAFNDGTVTARESGGMLYLLNETVLPWGTICYFEYEE